MPGRCGATLGGAKRSFARIQDVGHSKAVLGGSEAELRKDTGFARIQQIGWRVAQQKLRKEVGYRVEGG